MCFDVLNVIALGAAKPTRIMDDANLSSTTLQPLLQTLLERRYIAEDVRGRRHYRLTTIGERALRYYRRAVTGFAESTATPNPTLEQPNRA
jgi:predicted transcriptional regulator